MGLEVLDQRHHRHLAGEPETGKRIAEWVRGERCGLQREEPFFIDFGTAEVHDPSRGDGIACRRVLEVADGRASAPRGEVGRPGPDEGHVGRA